MSKKDKVLQNFQGEFYNTVDAKRRVSIPSKFREVLKEEFGGESLMLTRGPEVLVAYPLSVWEKVLEKVYAMPNSRNKDILLRNRVAPAIECSFDRQGRIQVSQPLGDHAGLVKDAVIVGLSNKIEIWSLEKHKLDAKASEEHLLANSQVVADVGL